MNHKMVPSSRTCHLFKRDGPFWVKVWVDHKTMPSSCTFIFQISNYRDGRKWIIKRTCLPIASPRRKQRKLKPKCLISNQLIKIDFKKLTLVMVKMGLLQVLPTRYIELSLPRFILPLNWPTFCRRTLSWRSTFELKSTLAIFRWALFIYPFKGVPIWQFWCDQSLK